MFKFGIYLFINSAFIYLFFSVFIYLFFSVFIYLFINSTFIYLFFSVFIYLFINSAFIYLFFSVFIYLFFSVLKLKPSIPNHTNRKFDAEVKNNWCLITIAIMLCTYTVYGSIFYCEPSYLHNNELFVILWNIPIRRLQMRYLAWHRLFILLHLILHLQLYVSYLNASNLSHRYTHLHCHTVKMWAGIRTHIHYLHARIDTNTCSHTISVTDVSYTANV